MCGVAFVVSLPRMTSKDVPPPYVTRRDSREIQLATGDLVLIAEGVQLKRRRVGWDGWDGCFFHGNQQ